MALMQPGTLREGDRAGQARNLPFSTIIFFAGKFQI